MTNFKHWVLLVSVQIMLFVAITSGVALSGSSDHQALAATPPKLLVQGSDGNCDQHISQPIEVVPGAGWSNWVSDTEGMFLSCLRFEQSGDWSNFDQDFQIGIQVGQHFDLYGDPLKVCVSENSAYGEGHVEYSRWASEGLQEGQAYDMKRADIQWDPLLQYSPYISAFAKPGLNQGIYKSDFSMTRGDCVRFTINTRPFPAGKMNFTKVFFCLQLYSSDIRVDEYTNNGLYKNPYAGDLFCATKAGTPTMRRYGAFQPQTNQDFPMKGEGTRTAMWAYSPTVNTQTNAIIDKPNEDLNRFAVGLFTWYDPNKTVLAKDFTFRCSLSGGMSNTFKLESYTFNASSSVDVTSTFTGGFSDTIDIYASVSNTGISTTGPVTLLPPDAYSPTSAYGKYLVTVNDIKNARDYTVTFTGVGRTTGKSHTCQQRFSSYKVMVGIGKSVNFGVIYEADYPMFVVCENRNDMSVYLDQFNIHVYRNGLLYVAPGHFQFERPAGVYQEKLTLHCGDSFNLHYKPAMTLSGLVLLEIPGDFTDPTRPAHDSDFRKEYNVYAEIVNEPTLRLSANPSLIKSGNSTTLTTQSKNIQPNSCVLERTVKGQVVKTALGPIGENTSQEDNPPANITGNKRTFVYSYYCNDFKNKVVRSNDVEVTQEPLPNNVSAISLLCNETDPPGKMCNVRKGAGPTVSWTSQKVKDNSCSLRNMTTGTTLGSNLSSQNVRLSIGSVSKDTTLQLTCTSSLNDEVLEDTVRVGVLSGNLTGYDIKKNGYFSTRVTAAYNDKARLRWKGTNASRCRIPELGEYGLESTPPAYETPDLITSTVQYGLECTLSQNKDSTTFYKLDTLEVNVQNQTDPKNPKNLSLDNSTCDSLKLTFEAPDVPAGSTAPVYYEIFRNESGDVDEYSQLVEIVRHVNGKAIYTSTYTKGQDVTSPKTVIPGHVYYYGVRARYEDDTGAYYSSFTYPVSPSTFIKSCSLSLGVDIDIVKINDKFTKAPNGILLQTGTLNNFACDGRSFGDSSPDLYFKTGDVLTFRTCVINTSQTQGTVEPLTADLRYENISNISGITQLNGCVTEAVEVTPAISNGFRLKYTSPQSLATQSFCILSFTGKLSNLGAVSENKCYDFNTSEIATSGSTNSNLASVKNITGSGEQNYKIFCDKIPKKAQVQKFEISP